MFWENQYLKYNRVVFPQTSIVYLLTFVKVKMQNYMREDDKNKTNLV